MKVIADRVADAYRILLRLYPIRFQQEYGEEMAAVFCQACRDSTEKSKWSVVQLGLHEVWDLPGNLMNEYVAEMGRKAMKRQPKPGELLTKSILRGIFSFSVGFGLIFFVYCLIDSLFNAGNTIFQGNSVWNKLGNYPTGLAFGFGAALMGLRYGKRKIWLSALAASIAFIFFYKIWLVVYNAYLSSANLELADSSLVPFVFETIAGIIIGGIIGLIQHGWKKAGWFAMAGVIGFNLGWIIEDAVAQFLIYQSSYNPRNLIVGDFWYFLYLVIPLILYGGIVGIVMGITSVGVSRQMLIVI
jgi:hypothetical protein